MTDQTQTMIPGLPVAGYRDQSKLALDTVNDFKRIEERILRRLDALAKGGEGRPPVDGHWLAIGRTELEKAFMSINRAVFQPGRVTLPEDTAAPNGDYTYDAFGERA